MRCTLMLTFSKEQHKLGDWFFLICPWAAISCWWAVLRTCSFSQRWMCHQLQMWVRFMFWLMPSGCSTQEPLLVPYASHCFLNITFFVIIKLSLSLFGDLLVSVLYLGKEKRLFKLKLSLFLYHKAPFVWALEINYKMLSVINYLLYFKQTSSQFPGLELKRSGCLGARNSNSKLCT